MGEERRLDCGVLEPEAVAKLINDLALNGTPMRHMQRRQGSKSVPDGYLISARVDGHGRLFGIIERD